MQNKTPSSNAFPHPPIISFSGRKASVSNRKELVSVTFQFIPSFFHDFLVVSSPFFIVKPSFLMAASPVSLSFVPACTAWGNRPSECDAKTVVSIN